MLTALKQLAYLLLFGSQPCKPITLVGRCFRWRVLVRFLAERPTRFFGFRMSSSPTSKITCITSMCAEAEIKPCPLQPWRTIWRRSMRFMIIGTS